MSLLIPGALNKDLAHFFNEDDIARNFYYSMNLPDDLVACQLKFKSDLVIAGLPYFFQAFRYLGAELESSDFLKWEGKSVSKSDKQEIHFNLPFSVALTGERIALNLIQRASSIATYTKKYVDKAQKYNIAILDTRKTTPGLRSLEKYAVRVGGGFNHRLGQADVWMVKDNHKEFFGGVKEAIAYFKSMQGFYMPMVVEIHNIEELKEAIDLKVDHLMLDNFTSEMIHEAVRIKPDKMTYEISGGVRLENIDSYLIEGIDAISIGALTYDAPHMDISLKYSKV